MAEYEVTLVGTWRRRYVDDYTFKSQLSSLKRRAKRNGFALKATRQPGLNRLVNGTFELTGDVKANNATEALRNAEALLQRWMKKQMCKPPRIRVE